MENECPFCWSRKIKQVGANLGNRPAGSAVGLMECEDCEKWYWADRQTEAGALFMHCLTTILNPERCNKDIRKVNDHNGNGFLKRRLAEFNHLCTECPNARFIPEPDSYPQRTYYALQSLSRSD